MRISDPAIFMHFASPWACWLHGPGPAGAAAAVDEHRAAAFVLPHPEQFRYFVGLGGFEAVQRHVDVLHPQAADETPLLSMSDDPELANRLR
jgi:hypothetical protein